MANIGRQDHDLPEEYQNFIQVMSQRGIFSDAEFKAIVHQIIGSDNFSEVLRDINKDLAGVELAVQPSTCEITGEKYWIFATTTVDDDDDQVEVEPNHDDDSDEEGGCVWFSKAKLELLKIIVNVIITSDGNFILRNDCINLVSNMENKFSRGSADKFLKQMINGSWLFSVDGEIYLGARGLTELMPYLKSENPNLKSCLLCKQTVIYGQSCQGCDKKMHLYCLTNYLKISQKRQCPECSRELHISNKLMTRYSNPDDDGQHFNHQAKVNRTQESTPGPSNNRRNRRRRIDDD